MMSTSKTIVFFGSGPVAAESLRLLAHDFEIEAVVTKPRPPHHKGEVPVLSVAEELDLKVLNASNRNELDDLFRSRPVQSKLAVLIDFGIIVSQEIIDYFPLGIVNSHFSILPQWRGADPISFALLSGQETTGVSLMLLVQAMDEGPLIAYGEHRIGLHETSTILTENLISLSHQLLVKHLPAYMEDPETSPQSVTGRELSYSRKLTKDDGIISWDKAATQIEREIRAFYEWPKSTTTIGSQTLIIREARVVGHSGKPGEYMVGKHSLVVICGKDALEILRVQPQNKKEMPIQAFLAGYSLD
jgi:methionyl-tRNA formyltransferase